MSVSESGPLWSPSAGQIARARLTAFAARHFPSTCDGGRVDYAALHQMSIDRRDDFWRAVWEFCGIRGEMGERIIA
ncbi:MAG: acetoacetate--CoA ligase, partial [Acidobacteriota bacterium]|nr:acetoacetate--CoA ligase [Acidobacteriota bacterium]